MLPDRRQPGLVFLLSARALRDFGDGFVAVLLPVYLLALGFAPLEVGIIATASLLGSALLTLAIGFLGARYDQRRLLLAAASLMIATGVAFAVVHDYALLLVVAFAGTINPSAGSVSVFVPLEHAVLTREVADGERTAMFARYSLVGALAAAVGALAAAAPGLARAARPRPARPPSRPMFVLYALLGLAGGLLYARIPRRPPRMAAPAQLGRSDPRAASSIRLAALFSLDAFAGGFVVQSLLALWLFERFDLSLAAAGALLLLVGRALGLLVSGRRLAVAADRPRQHDGVHAHPVEHLPDPGGVRADAAGWRSALLLIRAALSQMDVPTRSSYVMAVVTAGRAARPLRASPRCRAASPRPPARRSPARCSPPRSRRARS